MRYITALFLSLGLFSCWNNNAGDPLPSFSATTLDGQYLSTQDLKGKIVVIKIWATWCGSCLAEMPELNQLVQRYESDTNIVFLAITDDPKEKVIKMLERIPSNYQQITDAKDIKLKFQPGPYKEIPKHIVVDKQGNIVFDQSGEILNVTTILSKEIDALK